mmetsp:Transcript_36182/g.89047  ORF Transcript_36182/g.89047 Transcript_36182/m.89047 type:complete len:216 (-) Transcript_36182:383-1030(-)
MAVRFASRCISCLRVASCSLNTLCMFSKSGTTPLTLGLNVWCSVIVSASLPGYLQCLGVHSSGCSLWCFFILGGSAAVLRRRRARSCALSERSCDSSSSFPHTSSLTCLGTGTDRKRISCFFSSALRRFSSSSVYCLELNFLTLSALSSFILSSSCSLSFLLAATLSSRMRSSSCSIVVKSVCTASHESCSSLSTRESATPYRLSSRLILSISCR